MSRPAQRTDKVVPAQLNFLAVYSPPLGAGEATELDQIAFFWSRDKSRTKDGNYQLRQVGLAQGIVNFARYIASSADVISVTHTPTNTISPARSTFSTGQAVDSVETEKQRIILTELETSWWILAAIDLTRVPAAKSSTQDAAETPAVEYSSREVGPPALLLQQLRRAHRVFLLHHSPSLSDLYIRLTREKFRSLLDIYWTQFARTWDVLLHGNPSADVYGGIRLAAAGQLGIGVGEEEWGSGEREVLEALVQSTDGLHDMLLFRYGEEHKLGNNQKGARAKSAVTESANTPWLGGFQYPEGADGLVFTGVGALSKQSVCDVSDWVRDIFRFGENAYGLLQNPTSGRRTRRRKPRGNGDQSDTPIGEGSVPDISVTQDVSVEETQSKPPRRSKPNIPRPIVSAAEAALEQAAASATSRKSEKQNNSESNTSTTTANDPNSWRKYALLGYGYSWGGTAKPPELPQDQTSAISEQKATERDPRSGSSVQNKSQKESEIKGERPSQIRQTSDTPNPAEGHYLIGLRGVLRTLDDMESVTRDQESDQAAEDDWNNRLSLRTLYVELNTDNSDTQSEGETAKSRSDTVTTTEEINKRDRLRVVVYVHQPFIYLLLFDPKAPSLSMPSFFQSLHRNLLPLHRPLLNSTSPTNGVKRLQSALQSLATSSSQVPMGVYSLLHDPQDITTITSIPNIPIPPLLTEEGEPLDSNYTRPPISRIEALNVHLSILSNFADTRHMGGGVGTVDRERTSKTSRGFWVVWLRVPTPFTQIGAGSLSRPLTPHEPKRPSEESTGTSHPTHSSQPVDPRKMYREVILIRRAGDSTTWSARTRQSSGSTSFTSSYGLARLLGRGGDNDSSPSGSSPSSKRLMEGVGAGIGIDTKKYADALMRMLGS